MSIKILATQEASHAFQLNLEKFGQHRLQEKNKWKGESTLRRVNFAFSRPIVFFYFSSRAQYNTLISASWIFTCLSWRYISYGGFDSLQTQFALNELEKRGDYFLSRHENKVHFRLEEWNAWDCRRRKRVHLADIWTLDTEVSRVQRLQVVRWDTYSISIYDVLCRKYLHKPCCL